MEPAEAAAAAPPAVEATRWAALACALGLVALAFHAWLAQPAPRGWGLLALQVAPLAVAAPGLWRRRLYTYRWMSLLVWLYFLFALVSATSSQGAAAARGLLGAAVSLALFAACALHVRLRLRKPKS